MEMESKTHRGLVETVITDVPWVGSTEFDRHPWVQAIRQAVASGERTDAEKKARLDQELEERRIKFGCSTRQIEELDNC